MTPIFLRSELKHEVASLFEEYRYKSPSNTNVQLNVYEGRLPIQRSDEAVDPFPYVIVQLDSGSQDSARDSSNDVNIIFIIGMYNNSDEDTGTTDVLNIITGIKNRFEKNPCLNEFVLNQDKPIQWAVQEDGETHPYYYGGLEMTFTIPAVRKEDKYS